MGKHDGLVSLIPEFVDQGVVFHANPAVVTASTWADEEEFHWHCLLMEAPICSGGFDLSIANRFGEVGQFAHVFEQVAEVLVGNVADEAVGQVSLEAMSGG